MKKFVYLLILATLGAASAKADTISIMLAKANQTGTPGSTLSYFGTITNLTNTTVFLNGDYYNLTGKTFAFNDQFLNTVPISLAGGANSGLIELFDVTIPSGVAQTTTGTYGLTGGASDGAMNNLGSVSFTAGAPVSAPEIDPSLFATPLILLGGGIAVLRGRRIRVAA